LLVKAPREIDMQDYLHAWLTALPPSKGDIRLTVDVGPTAYCDGSEGFGVVPDGHDVGTQVRGTEPLADEAAKGVEHALMVEL
jgi:hypothetical protein